MSSILSENLNQDDIKLHGLPQGTINARWEIEVNPMIFFNYQAF